MTTENHVKCDSDVHASRIMHDPDEDCYAIEVLTEISMGPSGVDDQETHDYYMRCMARAQALATMALTCAVRDLIKEMKKDD